MSTFLSLVNGIPTSVQNPAAPTIYDQIYTVPNGGLNTGAAITLPLGETYVGEEMEVYLNGQRVKLGADYNTSGAGSPYSAVAFTFSLLAGEQVRFRIDRGA